MENQQVKVSVIIPVYNGQETLLNTISSALNQSYTNLEIIIVDDGSAPPMEPILQEINDNRIFYYYKKRSNANIARNYGISKSTGSYIAMLDADDLWLKHHISSCLTFLTESGADGLYGSLYLRYDKNAQLKDCCLFHARELKEEESMIDYLLSTGYGAQTSSLFTTTDSMKDIMWDPELIDHQDYDFVVRFDKKYKLLPKTEPTSIYNLSSGRKPHYMTAIKFVNKHLEEIEPTIYNSYNLQMLLKAQNNQAPPQIIRYFQREAIHYKEYLSYQDYISICNPTNCLQEFYYKLKYLWSIFKVKVEY